MNKGLTLLFLIIFSISNSLIAQVTVSGSVMNTQESSLVGAHISIKPGNHFGVTDLSGNFKIKELGSGQYVMTISHLGSKTYVETINIEQQDLSFIISLEDDPLALQSVVVTGTFEPRSKLSSSTAITTLESKVLRQSFPRGTAEIGNSHHFV